MYFEWCSAAVGDTESSARLVPVLHQHKFMLCCSSISPEHQYLHSSPSSHFPHLRASSAFPPSTSWCLSIPPWTHPGCSCWVSAEPSVLQRLEQWHCREGTTVTPAQPPLPKQRGWEHRHCSSAWERGLSHPSGSPGGGRPTEPHIQAGIHPGTWQSRVLFRRSKRIMSSLDTNGLIKRDLLKGLMCVAKISLPCN